MRLTYANDEKHTIQFWCAHAFPPALYYMKIEPSHGGWGIIVTDKVLVGRKHYKKFEKSILKIWMESRVS